MDKKWFFIIFFLYLSFSFFSQTKKIKVISIDSLKYYYTYKVYDYNLKDTLVLLSSKKDKDFKLIKLDVNNKYEVKTRLRSALKISDEKHYFVKPGLIFLNNVKISNGNNLPILITSSQKK